MCCRHVNRIQVITLMNIEQFMQSALQSLPTTTLQPGKKEPGNFQSNGQIGDLN